MRLWYLLPAMLVASAAGCGSLAPLPVCPACPSSAAPATETGRAGEPLAYYRRLIEMAPEELRREYLAVQAANDAAPDAANRMKLVMLLLVPDAPWKDDAAALRLLAADLAIETQGSRSDLVILLDRLVGERVRLLREEARKLDAAQQKIAALREENRKAEAVRQKLEAVNEECMKAEALRKKLEGLREIDRDMVKRPPRRSAP